jgi:hypothetical protein
MTEEEEREKSVGTKAPADARKHMLKRSRKRKHDTNSRKEAEYFPISQVKRQRRTCETQRTAWKWIAETTTLASRKELGELLRICRERLWLEPARWICSLPCRVPEYVQVAFRDGLVPSAFECNALPLMDFASWMRYRPLMWFKLLFDKSNRSPFSTWTRSKEDWIQMFRRRSHKSHWNVFWEGIETVDVDHFARFAEVVDHDFGKAFNESFYTLVVKRWTHASFRPHSAIYRAFRLGFSHQHLSRMTTKWAEALPCLYHDREAVWTICMSQPAFRTFVCAKQYSQLPSETQQWVREWMNDHFFYLDPKWLTTHWYTPKEYKAGMKTVHETISQLPSDLNRLILSYVIEFPPPSRFVLTL